MPETLSMEHAWAEQSLPWLVNQTLPAAEQVRLRSHLARCPQCRDALVFERALAQHLACPPAVDYTPNESFARLLPRLDQRSLGDRWHALQCRARRLRPNLAAAVLAQAAAILVLALAVGWLAWQPESRDGYRTLSSEPPVAAEHLQIVFEDGTTAAQIRALLQQVDGRVVAGPSPSGVFLVTVPGGQDAAAAVAAAAERLRDARGVRFVAARPEP